MIKKYFKEDFTANDILKFLNNKEIEFTDDEIGDTMIALGFLFEVVKVFDTTMLATKDKKDLPELIAYQYYLCMVKNDFSSRFLSEFQEIVSKVFESTEEIEQTDETVNSFLRKLTMFTVLLTSVYNDLFNSQRHYSKSDMNDIIKVIVGLFMESLFIIRKGKGRIKDDYMIIKNMVGLRINEKGNIESTDININ